MLESKQRDEPAHQAEALPMKNKEISDLFNEIADILELKEENVFRVNAYRRAAQNIEGLSRARRSYGLRREY